jgi:hypothetical protein
MSSDHPIDVACRRHLERLGVRVGLLEPERAQILAGVCIAAMYLGVSIEEFFDAAMADLDPMRGQPPTPAIH